MVKDVKEWGTPPLFASAKGGRGERSETQGVTPPRRCSPSIPLGHQGGGIVNP